MNHEAERLLQALSQEQQGAMGEAAVVLCALAALVRTHPNPGAFAAEFRRLWQQLGSPNQAWPADEPAAARMREALSVLEQACPLPLHVRPPDVAERPAKD